MESVLELHPTNVTLMAMETELIELTWQKKRYANSCHVDIL